MTDWINLYPGDTDSVLATSKPFFDVRDFGATGNGQTDDYRSINKAIATATAFVGSLTYWIGATIFFPRGCYYISSPLRLNQRLVLQGVSGGGTTPGSILLCAKGKTGIIVETAGSYPSDPAVSGKDDTRSTGEGSVIRDLAIMASGHYGSGASVYVGHGIRLLSRAKISNCYITGFEGDGIHIQASNNGAAPIRNDPAYTYNAAGKITYTNPNDKTSPIIYQSSYNPNDLGTIDINNLPYQRDYTPGIPNGTAPGNNDNAWQIENTYVTNCGRHGLFVHGVDANTGCAIRLDCRGNGGFGISESSTTGNTYISCHTANNALGGFWGGGVYQYLPTAVANERYGGDANLSLFLNCHAEEPTAKRKAGGKANSFANQCTIIGGSYYGAGTTVSIAGGNQLSAGMGYLQFLTTEKTFLQLGPGGFVFNGYAAIGGNIQLPNLLIAGGTSTPLDPRMSIIGVSIAPYTISAPAASASNVGQNYTIKKIITSGTVTVGAPPGQKIDCFSSIQLKNFGDYVTIVSSGRGWLIVNGAGYTAVA